MDDGKSVAFDRPERWIVSVFRALTVMCYELVVSKGK